MKTTFFALEAFRNQVISNYQQTSFCLGIVPTRFIFRMRRFGRMR